MVDQVLCLIVTVSDSVPCVDVCVRQEGLSSFEIVVNDAPVTFHFDKVIFAQKVAWVRTGLDDMARCLPTFCVVCRVHRARRAW